MENITLLNKLLYSHCLKQINTNTSYLHVNNTFKATIKSGRFIVSRVMQSGEG